jgi:hypothetical protein
VLLLLLLLLLLPGNVRMEIGKVRGGWSVAQEIPQDFCTSTLYQRAYKKLIKSAYKKITQSRIPTSLVLGNLRRVHEELDQSSPGNSASTYFSRIPSISLRIR